MYTPRRPLHAGAAIEKALVTCRNRMATDGVSRKAGRWEGTRGTSDRVFIRIALVLAGERTVHWDRIRGACGNKTIPRAFGRIVAQTPLSGPVGRVTHEIRSRGRALCAGVGAIETGGPGARRQQCHVAADSARCVGLGVAVAAPGRRDGANYHPDRKRNPSWIGPTSVASSVEGNDRFIGRCSVEGDHCLVFRPLSRAKACRAGIGFVLPR
jgi:hypothetical protein